MQVLLALLMHVSIKMDVPYDVLCSIAVVESNLNPNAVNPNSSARGLFQITRGTEEALKNKYGFKGSVFDPVTASVMAATLIKEFDTVDVTETYTLYFFGEPVGRAVLALPDDAAIKEHAPLAYKFNKSLIGNKTKKQLMETFRIKLEGATQCQEKITGL